MRPHYVPCPNSYTLHGPLLLPVVTRRFYLSVGSGPVIGGSIGKRRHMAYCRCGARLFFDQKRTP